MGIYCYRERFAIESQCIYIHLYIHIYIYIYNIYIYTYYIYIYIEREREKERERKRNRITKLGTKTTIMVQKYFNMYNVNNK